MDSGYVWRFDQNRLPWRLSLVRPEEVCSLRMGRSVTDAEVTLRRGDLCTCLMPIGPDGMTIESVNDGSPLLVSENEALYGRVTRVYQHPEAADPYALKLAAQQELSRLDAPLAQIRIDAVDVHTLTGESMDTLRPGSLCRFSAKEMGTEAEERIVQLDYPNLISTPERVKVTLANLPLTAAMAVNGGGRVR